jgi:hypothetical protein
MYRVRGGKPEIETDLLPSAEDVISWFHERSRKPSGIGIDALTCWSTGRSGWRPADLWLKDHYPAVRASVASPNSLHGAMSLNGMAVLLALRADCPELLVTETHPKVLHWHLRKSPYDYKSARPSMDAVLTEQLGCPFACESDHEWDAAISALAAYRCASGQWQLDLHALQTSVNERLINPCGPTKFAWPG